MYEKNAPGSKSGNEYWYNAENEQVRKQTDGKDYVTYEYDRRGNLIGETDEKTNTRTAEYCQ